MREGWWRMMSGGSEADKIMKNKYEGKQRKVAVGMFLMLGGKKQTTEVLFG